MSVTFTLAAADGPQTYIGIPCRCDTEDTGECEHSVYDVNVANTNARAIIDRLQLADPAEPLIGTCDPRTVLENLSAPRALPLPHGYRTRLRDLAAEAVRRRVKVGWA